MKMEKEIHELLLAYLRDDISEEEMIRLQGWLDENERHRKLLDELRDKEVLQQEIGAYASFDTSRRWIQLKEEMDKTSRKRRLLLRVWKSVAAVFVVAVAGGLSSGRLCLCMAADENPDRGKRHRYGKAYLHPEIHPDDQCHPRRDRGFFRQSHYRKQGWLQCHY